MLLDLGYRLARPLLFQLDAEKAHERVLHVAGSAPGLFEALAGQAPRPASLACDLAGLKLPSPIGLAAGLDKDAHCIGLWPRLGFGFVELGTVTPRPQIGNPRPRIWRLVDERAVINRMGFPSAGMAAVRQRMERQRARGWPDAPVGLNLGKNKETSADDAWQDYATLAEGLAELADFFTVNLSSPNTPGLRALQKAEPMKRILGGVLERAGDLPVFLKLSPDLGDEDLEASLETALAAGVSGIVATNTTLSRPGSTGRGGHEGGLSGAPLWPLASQRVKRVLEVVAGRAPVVGVGGISTAAQARELLDAGCTAVQLFTGFIYGGPGLPRRLNAGLAS